jgi:hypothetical protein
MKSREQYLSALEMLKAFHIVAQVVMCQFNEAKIMLPYLPPFP